MRIVLAALLAIAVGAVIFAFADFDRLAAWAVDAQRGFQNQMAGAVRALKAGEAGALIALLSAALAYGFVHALGPGHGKYLVGGIGIGSMVSTTRLSALAISSSLLQALWAVVLVYGGFFLIDVTARQLSIVAEEVLAPASYIAIGFVGLVLILRGARSLRGALRSNEAIVQGDCDCHSHGPSLEQASQIKSFRQAALLVTSIAIRPCTGAVFLLVIAWQMEIKLAGALAVVVMGLGTAALTSLVALASVTARRATLGSLSVLNGLKIAFPVVQIMVGMLVALTGLTFLRLLD